MLGGREKKKSSSPGKTRSDAASDSARNRKGGIKYRKSSDTTVGLINYCLAMVSMTVPAVGFSDDSKRPRVKGTVLTGRIRKVRLSLKQLDYSLLYHHASGRAA
jgi:hypothetical protein